MPVTRDDVRDAEERIRGLIPATPCRESRALTELCHDRLGPAGRVHCKLENTQRTGSFKERGALNRIIRLVEVDGEAAVRARGVVAASAGNHAQGVAYAASRRGIPATIFMPESAPLNKVRATRALGAEVVSEGLASFDDAMAAARRRADETGAALIHAYDDLEVIAGQGTVGREILDQVDSVTTVIVPVGGGGLISGIAAAVRHRGVQVIGVQTVVAPQMARRWASARGRSLDLPPAGGDTLAEGIKVTRPGRNTGPMVEALVDEFVVVEESEIAYAMFKLLEADKLVAEGAAAAAVAALLRPGGIDLSGDEGVVVVLSGGNVDVNVLPRIIERGMVDDGRLARLRATVRDEPGALNAFTALLAAHRANVLEISHDRAFADLRVREAEVEVVVETLGREETAALVAALEAAGLRPRAV